ncbi:MBL fold metallo-hydrolase RNA specificity domain-containing protein [Hydrogenophaga sp. BPS33]|uniref:MBL fold metallo-hydrolase RNA specificity domain-containing protein n=1 Tax=Hydrogenophaga sp. BPS33 TaxID=2651974 RepID=UPI00131F79CE|nr:MBL fold metallo-hydrolase [Hydrogenophaga sp. BPS33]QHE86129.1 MBL fold metallo-hydrolase [Hydrogenophaga sp. BPS33]
MQLQFLGATGTVTGSKYMVRHGKARLLIDCGLFQGYKQLRLRNWAPLPVRADHIDAVVLTHAHIDHSGYLPLLVKQGFRGAVYCTPATRDLCRIMLPDSGGLQEEEAEFLNRHRLSKHSPALPLYTRKDAVHCLERFHTVPWDTPWEPVHGVKARLYRAGHILGAASVLLDNSVSTLLFSGDLGRPADILMPAPDPIVSADRVVVESTYGDRLHPDIDPWQQLAHIIRRTAARGGVVIVPAFAVGRAQTLLHMVQVLMQRGTIPHLPVYLDSPMAEDATAVFVRHASELRISAQACRALPLSATQVRTTDQSRELCARRGPMVIIAGSGMATGGRVLHHIKKFAPDRRNTILLSGFQAGGTRGAALASGARSLRIHAEDVPIHCEVAQLSCASAHADAAEVQAWLAGMKTAPVATFVTHGEPAAADAMRQRIERGLGWNVCVPDYLETYAV